jgi:hypothetical protein
LTAALCDICQSSNIFLYTSDTRRLHQGEDDEEGNNVLLCGNYHYEIPVPRQTITNPELLRDVVERNNHRYCGYKYELPICPYIRGEVARITSMATISESLVHEGLSTVCTLPLESFLFQIPLDVGMIFRYNKDCFGFLHNFDTVQIKEDSLLRKIMVDDVDKKEKFTLVNTL